MFARLDMPDQRSRKPTRTIRITVTNDIYARLAFEAATAGVSVPMLSRTALLRWIVSGEMVPIDEVAAMLNLEFGSSTPPDVSPARGEDS